MSYWLFLSQSALIRNIFVERVSYFTIPIRLFLLHMGKKIAPSWYLGAIKSIRRCRYLIYFPLFSLFFRLPFRKIESYCNQELVSIIERAKIKLTYLSPLKIYLKNIKGEDGEKISRGKVKQGYALPLKVYEILGKRRIFLYKRNIRRVLLWLRKKEF